MPSYEIDISRTVTTTVTVEADSPEAAIATIDKVSFVLPAEDRWSVEKGSYEYFIDGEEFSPKLP